MPEINNSASTTYTFDGSTDSQTATSNILPVNLKTSSGLSVTKSASPTTYSAGDIINYTITITNTSSSYLNGVRIIDNLGGGNLAYVLNSATLSPSNSSPYPVTPIATNPLTFTLQELAVGASMTLTYKGQVIFNLPSTTTLITNNVQGIGYTATGTVTGFDNATIEKKTESDFSITKTASVYDVSQNQSFSYYLTINNNTSTIANVTNVTDVLPSNFNLTSVSIKGGSGTDIQLSSSDYSVSSNNTLTISTSSGNPIVIPANGSVRITLNGSFS